MNQSTIQLADDVQLSPVILLKAGELTCMYEMGKLRYIRKGDTELLRNIYAAVRDQHWATLPYTIEAEKIDVHENGFIIQYTAVYVQEGPVYKSFFRLEGKADNSIIVEMQGTALAGFTKNRIGLCVHHPVYTCSGQTATITTPRGTNYTAQFPQSVSPHQPFTDIQQMEFTTRNNIKVQLIFEGDVFETEDQRNWSDSSYKTYSTPLSVPFPVKVEPGDTCRQQITFSVTGGMGHHPTNHSDTSEEKIPFPAIGYCRSNHTTLTNDAVTLLTQLPIQHYRASIDLSRAGWQHELSVACAEATLLQTKLQLVLFFPATLDEVLHTVLSMLADNEQTLHSILILQQGQPVTPHAVMTAVYQNLKKTLPAIPVGYGTDLFFADLNRNRPLNCPFDFVSFHLHPQVHAADNRSILENLENLPDMVATAAGFSGGKPVFVSPITFKDRGEMLAGDEKQYSALMAWYTLMSMQQLAAAGSLTYHELLGNNGLIRYADTGAGTTGVIQTSPLYHALTAIQSFQPMFIIKRYAGKKLLLKRLLLENAAGARLAFEAPALLQHFNEVLDPA